MFSTPSMPNSTLTESHLLPNPKTHIFSEYKRILYFYLKKKIMLLKNNALDILHAWWTHARRESTTTLKLVAYIKCNRKPHWDI